ncbi:hypothetical protein [Actinomadura sp. 3N407]|uniref:hypothetical protein n=1 Tax=Actinomadura sp. 3N407 TaxID=3457423 RepID=UPI003FCD576F
MACVGPVVALFDLAAFGLSWWMLDVRVGPVWEEMSHTGWFTENLVAQGVVMLPRSRGRELGVRPGPSEVRPPRWPLPAWACPAFRWPAS